jgi:rare lipoprotein A
MIKNTILFTILSFYATSIYGQSYKETGLASFYADKFEGRTTANGEKYKHSKHTAAHKTLPFGTILSVINLENGKVVTVRVNDRGPFVKGRIIDLSKSAAKELNFINQGVTKVKITTASSQKKSKVTYSKLEKLAQSNVGETTVYYDTSGKEIKIKGFGVQIASFTKIGNLTDFIKDLHKKYNDRIFIQVSVFQNVKRYKVSVGHLKTREKAEKVNSKLKVEYPDSYVIKY